MGGPVRTFQNIANAGRDFVWGKDDPPETKIEAPPPVPDLTDDVVKKARAAALRRATGIAQDFLTGPLGDLSKPPKTPPAGI